MTTLVSSLLGLMVFIKFSKAQLIRAGVAYCVADKVNKRR